MTGIIGPIGVVAQAATISNDEPAKTIVGNLRIGQVP